jgi:hypothetical protein
MLCCPNCFSSELLRHEIRRRGQVSTCETCGADNQPRLAAKHLRRLFERFMTAYHPSVVMNVLGINGPSNTHNLAIVMQNDGVRVFNDSLPHDRRNRLLDIILGFDAGKSSSHWTSALEPMPSMDGWDAFRERIKHHRRYVVQPSAFDGFDLPKELKTDNGHFFEEITPDLVVYRARLHPVAMEHRRLQFSDIEAPPLDACKAGRANAAGIRFLYVADSEETAIAEIRPHIGAIVSVGQFRPRRNLRVFDLSRPSCMATLDPFCEHFPQEMRRAEFFAKLNQEFSRPIPPFTPERDYAPTQIVAEFIAAHGYDGIKYGSAMRPAGRNFVFFDCTQLEPIGLSSFKVSEVQVRSVPHDPEWMRNLLSRSEA